jgi:molybdopterin-guanine dinucleotide biosynthesis protein A
LLTGGASTRLGKDKASLEVAGESLRSRLMSELPHGQTHEIDAKFSGGPASAVIAYLPHVSTTLVALLAVDMPFSAPLVNRLVAAWDPAAGYQGLVPVDGTGREQWLSAVYSMDALREASKDLWIEDRVQPGIAMKSLVGGLRISRVPLSEADSVMTLDIDTPDDLAIVEEIMKEGHRHGS